MEKTITKLSRATPKDPAKFYLGGAKISPITRQIPEYTEKMRLANKKCNTSGMKILIAVLL